MRVRIGIPVVSGYAEETSSLNEALVNTHRPSGVAGRGPLEGAGSSTPRHRPPCVKLAPPLAVTRPIPGLIVAASNCQACDNSGAVQAKAMNTVRIGVDRFISTSRGVRTA